MSLLYETPVLVHAVRNSPAFQAIDTAFGLQRDGVQPAMSIVSQGEILAFAKKRRWGASKLRTLENIIARTMIIPIDAISLVERYADLEAQHETRGLNIGQNDLWIAATSIEYGLTLLTTDAESGVPSRLSISASIS